MNPEIVNGLLEQLKTLLGSQFSGGALQPLFLSFMVLFGFSFLRRIAFGSLQGLLPMLGLIYFMIAKDPTASKVVGSAVPAVAPTNSFLETIFQHPYFVPGVAILVLYTISRVRQVSLASAIAIVALAYLALGKRVEILEKLNSNNVTPALIIGCSVLAVFLALGFANRMMMNSYYGGSPWFGFSGYGGGNRFVRLALSMVSISLLSVLYFQPSSLKVLPGWNQAYAPYVFIAAMLLLGVSVLRRGTQVPFR